MEDESLPFESYSQVEAILESQQPDHEEICITDEQYVTNHGSSDRKRKQPTTTPEQPGSATDKGCKFMRLESSSESEQEEAEDSMSGKAYVKLDLLLGKYFRHDYPELRRAMLKCGQNINKEGSDLVCAYRYYLTVRNDSDYASMIRSYIKFHMTDVLADILLFKFNIKPIRDVISHRFNEALHDLINNVDFRLPKIHERHEVGTLSYLELVADRVIISVSCELATDRYKQCTSIKYDAVTINNDVIMSLWWFVERLRDMKEARNLEMRVWNDVSRHMTDYMSAMIADFRCLDSANIKHGM